MSLIFGWVPEVERRRGILLTDPEANRRITMVNHFVNMRIEFN
jgi:hypothetical protein